MSIAVIFYESQTDTMRNGVCLSERILAVCNAQLCLSVIRKKYSDARYVHILNYFVTQFIIVSVCKNASCVEMLCLYAGTLGLSLCLSVHKRDLSVLP